MTSAQRALAEVRPYLASHGGGVELVAVEPPLVRVRLTGTCTGCSQSSATLREVVERALVAGVPGVHRVEVVPNEPEPAMVPLSSIRVRPGVAPPADPDHGWTRGPDLADLPDERVTLWWPPGVRAGEGANGGPDDESAAVALVRLGDRVAAYANACVHQGLSLARGLVDAQGCVLTCPWHGMKYQALTGESLAAVGQRLTAYPARIDGGAVWLRLTG